MKLDDIKKVGIIGAGAMGNQIAEFLSRHSGYEVNIVDTTEELVNKGMQALDDRLERFFVAKQKITAEDKKNIMSRIKPFVKMEEAVKDVDLVIECVFELMSLKQQVFKQLDEYSPKDIVLATNSSTLNITEIGAVTQRPDKVVGMHFFSPVAVMKLVEVVNGSLTSQETTDFIKAFAIKLGKEPVVCRDTSYGYLANRAYGGLRREVLQMVWEKVASPQDIDKSLKLGYNLPMGPLEFGDMSGTWGRYVTMEADRIKELGPVLGQNPPILVAMVRAGYTGGPGKKGIYAFWDEVLSKW
jgi:3-hydroxybutyryl-CoA dehydrogenase